MSQPDFYAVLDECVSRLRQGDALEACLGDHPAHAAELAPDLALSAELLQLSPLEPSAEATAAGYEKLMAALDNQEAISPAASLSGWMSRLLDPLRRQQRGLAVAMLRVTVIAIAILVIAGSLVITAAADTLPGDALYPVKRSWEDARITLTTDDTSRQALQNEFERRRREEVDAVIDLRRPVVVEFTGDIESLAAGEWQVDGLALFVAADTEVVGAGAVGRSASIQALVEDDGSLTALRIVVDSTQILPEPTSTATPRPTQTSTRARSDLSTGSIKPTSTRAYPTPTPSPVKTRPESTATESSTDRPTRQPTPTSTPTSDSAPSTGGEPTRDPKPTSTRRTDSLATSAPSPTRTPENSDPTPTPRPVDVVRPTPTATAQPTRDLKPTFTPTATRNTDTSSYDERAP